MFSFKNTIMALAILTFIFSSCKKDDNEPASTKGTLSLEFDNVVGGSQLQLDSSKTTYTNASGEKFSLTQFNYYISNIRFRKSDGSEYIVPQDSSYFLVQENVESSQEIEIPNVPFGNYNRITFTVGVDSLRSTMDVAKRTGVLDPTFLSGHGMYWSWNTGYIFMKLEGLSASAPDSLGKGFYYHIGGYGGYTSKTINNLKTISLDLPTAATLTGKISPEVHLLVDAKKVFDGPGIALKIAENPVTMWGPASVPIANNYATMFSVAHVHNDPK